MRSTKTGAAPARFGAVRRRLDPQPVRQARETYRRFVESPSQPDLRFKQVHPTQPAYSVRVTYRGMTRSVPRTADSSIADPATKQRPANLEDLSGV